MSDFNYTLHFTPNNSSLVDGVWYNENTQELAVNLDGSVYAYTGVPRERFNDLAVATSAGREYQGIKREFGPGQYVGQGFELYFVYEPPKRTETVGTPKNLTVEPNNGSFSLSSSGTFHSGGLVTLGSQGVTETTAATEATRRHTVNFVIDDSLFSHTVHAADVQGAVQGFNEVMDSLGLGNTTKVKEVVTHFDN